MHHTMESLVDFYHHHNLMFHTLLEILVLITLQVTLTITCGMEFCSHHARLSQPCKVVNTLNKILKPCDNFVTT